MPEPAGARSGTPPDEPSPAPPEKEEPGSWSVEDKSWAARFSDDFVLPLMMPGAGAGAALRLGQASPWAARDPDADPPVAHTGLTVRDAAIVLAQYIQCAELRRRGGGGGGALGPEAAGGADAGSWPVGQASMHAMAVLELGSGGGLVGLVAHRLGARQVVCTEYSRDRPVLALLRANLIANAAPAVNTRRRIAMLWPPTSQPRAERNFVRVPIRAQRQH